MQTEYSYLRQVRQAKVVLIIVASLLMAGSFCLGKAYGQETKPEVCKTVEQFIAQPPSGGKVYRGSEAAGIAKELARMVPDAPEHTVDAVVVIAGNGLSNVAVFSDGCLFGGYMGIPNGLLGQIIDMVVEKGASSGYLHSVSL